MKFKKISGYERYEISKDGIIRNANNLKIKSQCVGGTGYYMISMSFDNKSKPRRVHRLLAITYIPNPKSLPQINHIDGNKLNNTLSNLEWCNNFDNCAHAVSLGLINNTGENNGMAKLSNIKVIEIRKMFKDGYTQQKIADKFNVSRSCILMIHLNKRWVHVKNPL